MTVSLATCGTSIFVANSGYHVLGGAQQTDIRDLQSCRRRCADDRACAGVDFLAIGNECWFIYNGQESLRPLANAVHYRKTIVCFQASNGM